jgi:DNA-binding transcriptional LysR family regulator
MDLRRMAMLVAVVENGSMRRAARTLSLTPSAVSQHIRQLERETGVTLLRRSTRRLTLTDAGQAFYEGCAAMVAAARSAHERLTALQEGVIGELSVSAPVGFATSHLTRALIPLLEAHLLLSLRIVATDDLLDLMRERIDLAITIGTTPPAASLIRRHLAD